MAHLTAAPVAASSYCAVQTKRRKTTACYKCRQQVPLINLSNRTNHRLRAVGKEQEEEPQLDSRPIVRASQDTQDEEDLGVRMALGALNFYKTVISPILPSACRYLPTCSSYSMDAYKKYGVVKGTVLTAWRLLRCNPFGSSGYDPVKWPPPGLEWLIKAES